MELFSAKEASFNFLNKKLGKEFAEMMIENVVNGTDENERPKRWMLKYMAFGAIILKYREQLDMTCVRVISLGDGQEEECAAKEYASEHRMECIHFGFLKHPTIEQLQEQWITVQKTCAELINLEPTGIPNDHFRVHEMSTIYKVDNNRHFSGTKRQLAALNTYFNSWIS